MERAKGRETTIKATRNKLNILIRKTIQELHGTPTHLETEINKETMLYLEFNYQDKHKEPIVTDIIVLKDSLRREYELSNLTAYLRSIVEKELLLFNSDNLREMKEILYQKEYESVTGKYACC